MTRQKRVNVAEPEDDDILYGNADDLHDARQVKNDNKIM